MKDSGFTLIELVFVCVALSILLAFSLPNFRRTMERLRVEQTAFAFAQLLRYAHEQAVAHDADILWTWDEQRHRAFITPAHPDDPDHPVALNARFAEQRAVPSSIAVRLTRQEVPVSCRCLTFFPDGTSEPTTLTIGQAPNLYTVTVDRATSQVRLIAGSAAR